MPRTVGSYRVKERLDGHDREVYLATRPAESSNRRYLLAFFDLADDDVEAFEAEVMRGMELDHPNVTRAVELLVHDGRQVIAYEGLPGTSLQHLVEHLSASGQELSDGAGLAIAQAVCEGIAAAHTAQDAEGKTLPLVHAQLGPHQVFLSWEGDVLLLGVGLSTIFRLAAGLDAVPDAVSSFVAPEVRKGGALTVRANVYTAAGIIWSLMTHEPFPTMPRSLRTKRPDLDKKLVSLVDRALSPNLMKRRVTCAQLARAIEASGLADPADLKGNMEELRAIETFEMSTIGAESFPPSVLADVPPASVPELLTFGPDETNIPASASEVPTLRRPSGNTLRPGPGGEAEPSTVPRKGPTPAKKRSRDRMTVVGIPPLRKPAPPKPKKSAIPSLKKKPSKPALESSPDTKSSEGVAESVDEDLDWASTRESATDAEKAEPEADEPEESAPSSNEGPAPEASVADAGDEPGTATTDAGPSEPTPPEPAPPKPEPAKPEPPKPEPAKPEPPSPAKEATGTYPSEPPAPPQTTGLPAWLYGAGAALFVVGVVVGRFTAPAADAASPAAATPTAETAKPAPSPPAPEPTTAPSTEPSTAPSTEPSGDPSEPPSGEVPEDKSHLVVTTVFPDAHVYLGGEYLGVVDEPLEVPCGIVNIRLGTKPLKRWFDSGRAVNAKCGEVVKITIAPDPDPYLDDIY